MSVNFTTSGHVSNSNGVKMSIYAPAGSGKTVLTATAPTPVVISAESGLLSLRPKNLRRIFGDNDPSITYDVPVMEIKTIEDLDEALRWCQQSHEAKSFQTINIDSLSEIGEVVLNNAKRTVKDPRQAYGELIEKMETKIREFRDLQGKHVVMLAKQEPFKDELTGVVKYGPSMPGAKLAVKLPYFFDEVFRLGIGQDPQGLHYRFLQTQPDLQYEAKDRSGALDKIEYPNLTHVINKILGD